MIGLFWICGGRGGRGELEKLAHLGLELGLVGGQKEFEGEFVDHHDGLFLPVLPADLADLTAEFFCGGTGPRNIPLNRGRGVAATNTYHFWHFIWIPLWQR